VADGAESPTGDTIAASARAGEPDRYLAALLAPPPARPHLLALAAFSSELARVASAVTREPMMGEVRLQWWRDALEPAVSLARTGNPIADAVRTAVLDRKLPRTLLFDMIDARALDLAREPIADDAALRDYLWKSEGVLFALAAGVLGREPGMDLNPVAAAGGHAYGLVRLLLGLPRALSRGRLPLPQSRLQAVGVSREELLAGDGATKIASVLADLHAEARASLAAGRQHVANLPRDTRSAFLPLALVETYLRALERPRRDVLRTPAEIAPLTRVYRIAVAHWLGRI
jgi:15-cis-phytoene synthase